MQFGIQTKAAEKMLRPSDCLGGYDYLDCDSWMFFNVPSGGVIAPLRPYTVITSGFPERCAQIKNLFSKENVEDGHREDLIYGLISFRSAAQILALNIDACVQSIEYAGVIRNKVRLLEWAQFEIGKDMLEVCKKSSEEEISSKGLVFLYSFNESLISGLIGVYAALMRENKEVSSILFIFKKKLSCGNKINLQKLIVDSDCGDLVDHFSFSEMNDNCNYFDQLIKINFRPAFMIFEGCGADELKFVEQMVVTPGWPIGVSPYTGFAAIVDPYNRIALIESEICLRSFMLRNDFENTSGNRKAPGNQSDIFFSAMNFDYLMN
jgi:hypothetical protein